MNPSRTFANGDVKVIGLKSSVMDFGGEYLGAGCTRDFFRISSM